MRLDDYMIRACPSCGSEAGLPCFTEPRGICGARLPDRPAPPVQLPAAGPTSEPAPRPEPTPARQPRSRRRHPNR